MHTVVTMQVTDISLIQDLNGVTEGTRLQFGLEGGVRRQAAPGEPIRSGMVLITYPIGVRVPFTLGQRVVLTLEPAQPAAVRPAYVEVPRPGDETAAGLGARFDRDVMEAPTAPVLSR